MQNLIKNLKAFYSTNKRDLPWRATTDPYHILVSELMLQQTQAARVIPKYEQFIKTFPTVKALARASLFDVLRLWSGLGYNRRAKYLHEAAAVLLTKYKGEFPRSPEDIETLPGVGHYTARAIAAFAFNAPGVFIETNIRTVFIHFCFTRKKGKSILISDKEILPFIERALRESKMQPRDFYAALMDYGSHLKQRGIQLNARSRHYNKQGKFEGSYRQLRGAVLRAILQKPSTIEELVDITGRKRLDVARVLDNLTKEELVEIKNHKFSVVQ